MALVSRDTFARTELHRERTYLNSGYTCMWCGQTKTTPKGRCYLFSYRVESDGGRKDAIRGLYCSNHCHAAYNS